MNNKFAKLREKLSKSEEIVYQRKAELQEFIFPIIKAAGIGEPHHEYIVDIYDGKDYVTITTEWSARNCSNNSDYKVPKAIIEADDPLLAAAEWKTAEGRRKAEQQRQSTLAQIEHLKKSLGESK